MDYYISRKHYLLFQSNLSIYQKGLKVHVLFDKETMIIRLKLNIFQRILCLFNVFRRLLRVDIRSYVLAKNIFVFSFKNALYSINLIEKTYTVTYFKKSERPPLNIVYISGSKKCKDGFYFGQYPNNDQRHAVEILFSSNGKKWSCIYTFGEGAVNHVHSIVHDRHNDNVFILTGDYDDAANIWSADFMTREVKPLFGKETPFRCCHLFFLNDKLYSCTDYPDKPNRLCEIIVGKENALCTDICSINGSSIYGIKIGNMCYFSTEVEPDYDHSNVFSYMLSTKRGSGINSNDVCVYSFDGSNPKIIFKAKKDCLPYGLFQFGYANFPLQEKNKYLLVYFRSVHNYDGKTVFIKMNGNDKNENCDL